VNSTSHQQPQSCHDTEIYFLIPYDISYVRAPSRLVCRPFHEQEGDGTQFDFCILHIRSMERGRLICSGHPSNTTLEQPLSGRRISRLDQAALEHLHQRSHATKMLYASTGPPATANGTLQHIHDDSLHPHSIGIAIFSLRPSYHL
jgi:hypothetical protein